MSCNPRDKNSDIKRKKKGINFPLINCGNKRRYIRHRHKVGHPVAQLLLKSELNILHVSIILKTISLCDSSSAVCHLCKVI